MQNVIEEDVEFGSAANDDGHKVVHLKNAGFDTAKVPDFVGRIENVLGELDTMKAEYMNRCKDKREDIKFIYDEAKDAGIPKRELKAVIAARGLERKARQIIEDLEPEQQDTCLIMREALGDFADTPLGRAALGDDEKDLDDLTDYN